MNKVPIWAYASAALTILCSLYGLSLRHREEAGNRAVGFAIEADAVELLADLTGEDGAKIASELKDSGVTALIVSERTIGELVDRGRVKIVDDPKGPVLRVDSESAEQFRDALSRRGIRSGERFNNFSPVDFSISASLNTILATPVALDKIAVEVARESGLPIIARHANYFGANGRSILETLKEDKEAGAIAYLPMGETVVGFKSELPGTIDALRETGLHYLTVEFGKMPGDSRVRSELPLQTIRMHSIQGAEMDKLTPADVKERYVKAARERQLHWLLIRPQSTASADPVGDFSKQIAQLREALRKDGLDVKEPRPFKDFEAPAWYCTLLALCALPAIAWLILQVPIPKNLQYAGIGVTGLLALGCWMPSMRGWYGLGAASAFPVLAYFHLLTDKKRNPVIQYVVMALISMAGGLVVASMLIGPQWMLQNKLFVGPKFAHYVPILVVGVMLLAVQVNLKEVMKKPLIWSTTLAAFAILAVLLFMQTRLGNDNPAGVSGLELKFRSIMDSLLYVRPRTKEFLIGNPALFLGIALWNRNQKLWGGLLLGAGAIGLTSIVNTFCHLHTPIQLSLARVGIGLVVGGIMGAAIWGVLAALLKTREGHKSA